MKLDVRWLRAALVLFALAVFLPGLTALPPGDRDESRFAQATKQMMETGDYLRIMNGAEARNKKPIGIYWLQAPFVRAAGEGLANPIWPYRLPSVLGGVIAVLATFEAGLVLFETPAAAAFAAAMLAASVILAVETHIAKTDAALLGATTIVLWLLARAYRGLTFARWQAALFWLAFGAGILIKGPITPMVAGLCSLTLVVADRRADWLRALRPAWGAPLALAIVLPWFVAIGVATHGQFFSDAVGGDLGHKLAGGAESHGGFPGLHLLLLPLLAFPASMSVLQALPATWRSRTASAPRFLIAWAGPSWLVFEAVPTKLPHYTLPLYPALFLLAAGFRLQLFAGDLPRWWHPASRALFLVAGALFGLAALVLPIALHGPWWLGIPALLAVLLATVLTVKDRLLLALATMPLVTSTILGLELPALQPLWIAPRVEALLRVAWPRWNSLGRGLVAAGYAEPSLMFTCGTDLKFVPTGTEAATRLLQGDTAAIVALPDLPDFLATLGRLGVSVQPVGNVSGFNYSRGHAVTLRLFVKIG